jgi:hypothetical protein
LPIIGSDSLMRHPEAPLLRKTKVSLELDYFRDVSMEHSAEVLRLSGLTWLSAGQRE